MIWLKDYKYDGGGWITDASLKSIHKRWCTRGGTPVEIHQRICTTGDATEVMQQWWCTRSDAPEVMHQRWCTRVYAPEVMHEHFWSGGVFLSQEHVWWGLVVSDTYIIVSGNVRSMSGDVRCMSGDDWSMSAGPSLRPLHLQPLPPFCPCLHPF